MTRDLRDSLTSVIRRWRRNLLTLTAIALGAASLTAVAVVTQSSAQATVATLDRWESTVVLATLPPASWEIPEEELVERGSQIAGVEDLGTLTTPDAGTFQITVERLGDHTAPLQSSTVVASAAGLTARGARTLSGAIPDPAILERDPRHVALGLALARELDIDSEPGSNQIAINGRPVTVTAILLDDGQQSLLSTSLVLSVPTAEYLGIRPLNRLVTVRVAPGAAESVAQALPATLDPAHIDEIALGVAPSPKQLREQLLTESRSLVTAVAALMSVATMFSIVTTMQMATWERRREIGLTRALGLTRGRIARRFLWEAAALGLFGATSGFLFGILASNAICHLSGTTSYVPMWTLLIPPAGAAVGTVAGAWPAWSATRVDPAELLRST